MTKNKTTEETQQPNKLVWRLAKAPSLDDVTKMLEQHVISKEEARDILFNVEEDTPDSEKNKALKEQIKFLENVIEKLANKQPTSWFNYTPSLPVNKYWNMGNPSIYLVSSGGNSVSYGSISSRVNPNSLVTK